MLVSNTVHFLLGRYEKGNWIFLLLFLQVKSPGVEERRQINGKASSTEAEMELRGQIEVHIEPPDNDTTAGSKVSYNLTYLVFFLFSKNAP